MFRAYDAGRERLVAVKLFKLDLPPERVHQLVGAFEQLIAADLTHPAMAVPLATGITDVSAYLAQDYVAAESLDLAVREYGAAPAADALRVAAQLAGALDFAAVVNIAHGALHPRDILLSADETRMTGVGVARALESVGVGVPVRRPYTAPERIAGGEWDRRADVFSLAALIHELLWARRVTGTGHHIADTLTDLADADRRMLQSVFARALADDPDERFDTALEFVDALKAAFPRVTMTEPAARKRADSTASTRSALPKTVEPLLPLEAPDAIVESATLAPPTAAAFDASGVDIRGAEEARFQQVDTAPSVVTEAIPPMREAEIHDLPISMIEQSRSAVWPLVASLLIGLALGFAGGYGVGTRERPSTPAAAIVDPTLPRTAPAGREATDVAIAEPPKPAPAPEAPPIAKVETPKPAARAASRRETAAQRPAPDRAASRRTVAERSAGRPAATAGATATSNRFQGGLNVDSRPTGARVFLDGRLVGNTPLAMPAVAAGEHAIRIERDGYRRWSSSVRVVAAEQNRVTASLER